MIEKIKKNSKRILSVILLILIVFIVYNNFFNINNIATGDYISSLNSQNNKYTLKSYLIKGDSLSGNSIRVELINNVTNSKKNIYFNYPENSVSMEWLDSETVRINETELNIYKDIYDWRLN